MPVDQQLFAPALERLGEEELQRQVLAGGYRLVDWRNADPLQPRERLLHIAATGVMIPESCESRGGAPKQGRRGQCTKPD